jgi:hypothetical protein
MASALAGTMVWAKRIGEKATKRTKTIEATY